jgi:hypothetical protein
MACLTFVRSSREYISLGNSNNFKSSAGKLEASCYSKGKKGRAIPVTCREDP